MLLLNENSSVLRAIISPTISFQKAFNSTSSIEESYIPNRCKSNSLRRLLSGYSDCVSNKNCFVVVLISSWNRAVNKFVYQSNQLKTKSEKKIQLIIKLAGEIFEI